MKHALLQIKIDWDFGQEMILLDLEAPPTVGGVLTTVEWWRSPSRTVKFFPVVIAVDVDRGFLELEYRETDHSDLTNEKAAVRWGRSRIDLKAEVSEEKAQWADDGQLDVWYRCKKFSVVDTTAQRKHRSIEVRDGKQQESFRATLLALDNGKCAVSSVNTAIALDAAHIDAFGNDGSYHPANGLLLRKDLHALFDAGILDVNADGCVELAGAFHKSYLAYEGKAIDRNVYERVKSALESRKSVAL